MGLERIFSVFRISGTGMSAQRRALDATASNIANIETTDNGQNSPYIPKRVAMQETGANTLFDQEIRRVSGGLSMQRSDQMHMGKRARSRPALSRTQPVEGSAVQSEIFEQQENAFKVVYEPNHPDADEKGYVRKSNINLVGEMTDMMVASRAYEANVSVMTAAKNMMKRALEI